MPLHPIISSRGFVTQSLALLAFLQRKLPGENACLPLLTDVILQLIRLCVESNPFSFEGRFYSPAFGVSMGIPLSPVLANLFMEYFKSELLPSTPFVFRFS